MIDGREIDRLIRSPEKHEGSRRELLGLASCVLLGMSSTGGGKLLRLHDFLPKRERGGSSERRWSPTAHRGSTIKIISYMKHASVSDGFRGCVYRARTQSTINRGAETPRTRHAMRRRHAGVAQKHPGPLPSGALRCVHRNTRLSRYRSWPPLVAASTSYFLDTHPEPRHARTAEDPHHSPHGYPRYTGRGMKSMHSL